MSNTSTATTLTRSNLRLETQERPQHLIRSAAYAGPSQSLPGIRFSPRQIDLILNQNISYQLRHDTKDDAE
jgi:hypothetical protein